MILHVLRNGFSIHHQQTEAHNNRQMLLCGHLDTSTTNKPPTFLVFLEINDLNEHGVASQEIFSAFCHRQCIYDLGTFNSLVYLALCR